MPRTNGDAGTPIGVVLAPYYRHFLPIFNLFKSNRKLSAADDYKEGLVELMDDTLHYMEMHGGPEAAREINRCVPLYHLPRSDKRRAH